MNDRISCIRDVVEWQLCTGCGACAGAEPKRFTMVDVPEHGRRPVLTVDAVDETGDGLKVCPGVSLEHSEEALRNAEIQEFVPYWGPVDAVWEAYAGDEDIRWEGSSGGAASMLALYCLENGIAEQVLHTAADEAAPLLNKTVLSKDREDLLGRTGSRYAPASPCDGLSEVEETGRKTVFIGKPCDVAGMRRLSEIRPKVAENLVLSIGFFCAGVPSSAGNMALLHKEGFQDQNGDQLKSLRYRGRGWPGNWVAVYGSAGSEEKTASLTYADSWGFLQRFRQWRCYICPDHTGEFADISVGDPWHGPVVDGAKGTSLILARTARGRKIVNQAIEAGYLKVIATDPALLPKSQPNLLRTRAVLFGRLFALRLAGGAVPSFVGFSIFRNWRRDNSFVVKVRSVLGTLKRIYRKKLYRRQSINTNEHRL